MWDQLLEAIREQDQDKAIQIIAQITMPPFDQDYHRLTTEKVHIHLAVYKGFAAVVQVLINIHPNFASATSKDVGQLLHIATSRGHQETVKMLLDFGVDSEVNELRTGEMALHHAASYGHQEIVKILLDAGANPNATDKSGKTPLHSAAINGNVKAVKTLIGAGSNVNTIDKYGKTPLDLAIKHEDPTKTLVEELFATANITNQAIQYANSSDTRTTKVEQPIKHLDLFIAIIKLNFDKFNPLSEDGKLFNRLARTTSYAGLSDEDSLQVKNAIEKDFENKTKNVIDCAGFPSLQFLAENNSLIEQLKSVSNKEKDSIQQLQQSVDADPLLSLHTSRAEDQAQIDTTLQGQTNE